MGSAASDRTGDSRSSIRLAAIDDVEPGSAMLIDAELAGTEDDLALIRDEDGTYYALDDTCSHGAASLSEGWIEDNCVECPLHSSQFELRTGRPRTLPATVPVATHALEVRDGEVFLILQED